MINAMRKLLCLAIICSSFGDLHAQSCVKVNKLAVLDFGPLYIPARFFLAVEGSLRHNQIMYISDYNDEPSSTYESITIYKKSDLNIEEDSDLQISGSVCGISYYAHTDEFMEKFPRLEGVTLFLEAGGIAIGVSSASQEDAVETMKQIVRLKCVQ